LQGFTIFICNPHEALERQLIAESIQAEVDYQLEADLERAEMLAVERGEYVVEVRPDKLPLELLRDWDAYHDFVEKP
jgi:hypothetical protein